MSVHATPVPHFSGKNELSLQDLDALANAVQAQGCTAEYVPAGMPRGRRQYTGANYNLALFADECSGSVATPDKPGTLASVQYRTSAAPYIDNGNMVLPLAHDFDTADDSSLPPEQATGGICTISVPEGLKRPQIDRGNILLPLAHSDWGEDAEGAMCTPGLVYAVQVDAADDECSGTVGSLPYIDQGVIHLPAGAGGGGGALSGVVNTSGEPVTWAQMQSAPVRLAVMFLDGYRLYLTGQVVNGFFQLNTEAV